MQVILFGGLRILQITPIKEHFFEILKQIWEASLTPD